MALFGLFGGRKHERAGYALYTAAVTAARDPVFYRQLGVPDTMDGRFDMVGLYVFLVIHRLRDEGETGQSLGQAVFDAMFHDMDFNLREIGVSDMRVGKTMKGMWEAFHGRSANYAAPLLAGDEDALAAAIARNVWRGTADPAPAHALAAIAISQDKYLAAQPLTVLATGQVAFLPAAVPA